jgi:hypothetical protein
MGRSEYNFGNEVKDNIFYSAQIFSICVELLWGIILGEKRMLLKFFSAYLDKYSKNKGFLFNVEI